MDEKEIYSEPILRVTTPDGKVHDVSIAELCITNNITYQALVTMLVRKGLIDPKELLAEVERIQKERLEKK